MSNPSVESLLIANARLLDPSDGFDATGYLGIRGDRIVYRGTQAPGETFAQTLDARGQWLMPGLIDLCTRLREPGATHKATLRSETAAAAAGGITTVCLPPDTKPIIDHPSVLDRIRGIVQASGNGVHVLTLGALTQSLGGEVLAEMSALRDAGCVGVSQGLAPIADWRVARRALEYAAGLGLTVHVVPLDPHLGADGCAHEGALATRLGLSSVPVAAEVAAIRAWISIVEDTGARVHFGRLSSARAVELMESARSRNLPVTADVAAHQLFLTDAAIADFNAVCHVVPVLREARDRDALRHAVRNGIIDAVCSDHQPHEADAKINPFPWTEPGISALDTLLPLMLQLVHQDLMSPLALAERLASGPARVLGLTAVALSPGSVADLVLVDSACVWRADIDNWRSAGRNSPFLGNEFVGRAALTIAAGRVLWGGVGR